MSEDILRLHYQERQFLGARDFEDEQSYLLESRRRNNVAQRTWGILSGLEIRETVMGSGLWIVTAGGAIDGYGRETYLLEDTPLDLLEIGGRLSSQSASLKIWLSYATERTSPAAGGYVTCQDAGINTRTRESFRLIYQDNPVPFDAQMPDDATLWPLATDDLPDDPKEKAWPLLLGTIEWDGTKIVDVKGTGRRYSGMRGAEVVAQTPQLDVHPARVRLVVDAAEEAVLTTGKGAGATGGTALHLRTNDDTGGANVIIDKDDVELGKSLTVTGVATLKSTVGNGAGMLILETDAATNLATLTRKNGTSSNHDIAIRTKDGTGGNSILIDRDTVVMQNVNASGSAVLQSVTVLGSAILKSGLQSWGQIVLQKSDGTDDSDAMVISRVAGSATNRNDLRVQIGDDTDASDRFVVGPVDFSDQQFKEQFIVDNAGNVTAKGAANISGALTTGGLINGRNLAVDGPKLDTISAKAREVAVETGIAANGVSLLAFRPAGFATSECRFFVSPHSASSGSIGPFLSSFGVLCAVPGGTVQMEWNVSGNNIPGFVNFLIIGVK